MTDIGPRDVQRFAAQWWLVAVIAAILLGGLILGGWEAGWWFAQQDVNRQAHVIRNGYANQQTLREEITKQIANTDAITLQIAQAAGDEAEIAALDSQRIAVVNIACQDASEITGDPLPAQQAQWVRTDCLAGVIRPGSRYDATGGNQ